MEIGIDSFVAVNARPAPVDDGTLARRVRELLEEIELADRCGVDVFAVGEHHREEFVASSPAVLLAAAAARTKNIRLASAVSVLSSDDPIRLFQQFATIDLISGGRAEIIVGRGSFIESYPLFGFDLKDYDTLFAEKLDLLLKLRDSVGVTWAGRHRAPLTGQGVFPRPVQNPLPIRLGVGGTPQSFARAGMLGMPLVIAIIGGEFERFRPLVELYREARRRGGHAGAPWVGVHTLGFVGDTAEAAAAALWPSHQKMMTKIGSERGWPPLTRAQFDQSRSPGGALLCGSPREVADKIAHINEALGGVERVTLRMDGQLIAHHDMLRAVELLGRDVKAMVPAHPLPVTSR